MVCLLILPVYFSGRTDDLPSSTDSVKDVLVGLRRKKSQRIRYRQLPPEMVENYLRVLSSVTGPGRGVSHLMDLELQPFALPNRVRAQVTAV